MAKFNADVKQKEENWENEREMLVASHEEQRELQNTQHKAEVEQLCNDLETEVEGRAADNEQAKEVGGVACISGPNKRCFVATVFLINTIVCQF